MTGIVMIASDCEALHSGLLDQPVNAVTSLALVMVAPLLAERRVLAILAAVAGVGSFLFHGFGGFWAEWAHDVSLAWLLAGLSFERRVPAVLVIGAALGIGFWAVPEASEPTTIAASLLAGGVLAVRGQLATRRAGTAAAILAVAGTFAVLSRTGGPLCSSDSLLQGHGLWHVGAAIALLVWGQQPALASETGICSRLRRQR